MRRLSVDALPKYSAWTRYLLDPTDDPPADPQRYTGTEQYEEAYTALLDTYRGADTAPADFVRDVYATGRSNPGPISVRESLLLASPTELLDIDRYGIRAAFAGAPFAPETVLDLGCGYGAALRPIAEALPETRVIGGECVESGVTLARALTADHDAITVEQFDFTGSWNLIDATEGPTVVFTRGVMGCLPDTGRVVDRLVRKAAAGEIGGGVHLEQSGPHPGTTLGLLRGRYADIRGYDTSFFAALRQHDAADVQAVTYDAVGANPLYPQTLLRWRPAQA